MVGGEVRWEELHTDSQQERGDGDSFRFVWKTVGVGIYRFGMATSSTSGNACRHGDQNMTKLFLAVQPLPDWGEMEKSASLFIENALRQMGWERVSREPTWAEGLHEMGFQHFRCRGMGDEDDVIRDVLDLRTEKGEREVAELFLKRIECYTSWPRCDDDPPVTWNSIAIYGDGKLLHLQQEMESHIGSHYPKEQVHIANYAVPHSRFALTDVSPDNGIPQYAGMRPHSDRDFPTVVILVLGTMDIDAMVADPNWKFVVRKGIRAFDLMLKNNGEADDADEAEKSDESEDPNAKWEAYMELSCGLGYPEHPEPGC